MLAAVLADIDAANALDPTTATVRGRRGPKELLHSELMAEWVLRLDPGADTAQRIAARAHHLRRWEHPRSAQPEGRAGYLRWRAAAKRAHAEAVGEVMARHGASSGEIARVQSIVRKEGLGRDPAVQVHEDALCLVFLETQLDQLLDDLGREKTLEVLRRTSAKMSASALAEAGGVELSSGGAAALRDALRDDGDDPAASP